MLHRIFLPLLLISIPVHAFVSRPALSKAVTVGASVLDDLGSSTIAKENYDVVKVDLDDGRDYPIYIGTGYSDEECKSQIYHILLADRLV